MFFQIFEKTQAILLDWFAVQQQISTSRSLKLDLFYSKFSTEFNELSCKKDSNLPKIWLKLKQSTKPQLCGIWGLRVNRWINNPWEV